MPEIADELVYAALENIRPHLGGKRNSKGGFDLGSCPICGGHGCLSMNRGARLPLVAHCFQCPATGSDILRRLKMEGLLLPDVLRRSPEAEENWAALQAKRRQDQNKAAKFARLKSRRTTRPDRHPYLRGKFHPHLFQRIYSASPIGQDGEGRMLVFVFEQNGELVSFQYIYPDGAKRLLKDGQKQGCFHPIGVSPMVLARRGDFQALCFAEGWATAMAVYLSTGIPTIMTVDAGNMPPVTKIVRGLVGSAVRFILCADEDTPGIMAAENAAAEAGGMVARPVFSAPEALYRKGYDFWDLFHEHGSLVVNENILNILGRIK